MLAFPPKKILAIKLRALGDTVLMTAPLLELKRLYPAAEIHAAITEPWVPLLENHPAVHKIWRYARHDEKTARAKAIARLGLRLRREHFDCVINFHASPSSALLAFATGAATRSIHFHGHRDRNRYSTVIIPGKGQVKPNIERDMDAVRALGWGIPEGRLPQLFLTPQEIESAEELLTKTMGLKKPILGLGLGASRPTKSWPLARFVEVARLWTQTTGGSALAFCAPQEPELKSNFLNEITVHGLQSDGQITIVSPTTVRELAADLKHCAVFLGNDSGPKHIAVSVQTPTVTLFGPEDPFEWHPYPKDRHPYFYREGLACRRDADPGMPPWCALEICVQERHRCMQEIDAQEVFQQCKALL